MPKNRRTPTSRQEKEPKYRAVTQRGGRFEELLMKALQEARDKAGGVTQLEDAIAKATGGFAIVERRKLKTFLEATQRSRDGKPVMLSLLELAALDEFWKDQGGFLGKLRLPSLAESMSDRDHLIAFIPSLPWPDKSETEKIGYVPVADVRAAATLRQIVLGLNPRVAFQFKEVPSGVGQQAEFGRLFGPSKAPSIDALLDNIPQTRGARVALVALGSSRSNLLTDFLMRQFFKGAPPFEFRKEGGERRLIVGREALMDHAVICVRRVAHGATGQERLELIVAGDRSLSTVAAASEIVNFRDSLPLGAVTWALVKVTLLKRSEIVHSEILPDYPITIQR